MSFLVGLRPRHRGPARTRSLRRPSTSRAADVAARQASSRRIWWWVLGVAIAIAVGYGIWLLIYVANSENTLV